MTQPEVKSKAASLASLSAADREAFLASLSENALASLPYLFDFWAHPQHQLEPAGDWTTWVILGGRGAGKTRAGAEWVRSQMEGPTPLAPGRAARFALLGETFDQVRAVMIEGESGIMAVSPPDRRPDFQITRRCLVWPNGAEARMFSAADPEGLRGPQFDGAWSDELAKWRRCRDAWDMLQFGLRLGVRPRQLVTTTPRDNPVLLEIMNAEGTRVTHAATAVNRAHLAPDFVDRLHQRYAGTSLGRQELDGELVREHRGALWSRPMIEEARAEAPGRLDRVVVAVDPPVTATSNSDECGIVVAGIVAKGPGESEAYVLDDLSVAGQTPRQWAELAAAAYARWKADRLVAEVNQGGDLVESRGAPGTAPPGQPIARRRMRREARSRSGRADRRALRAGAGCTTSAPSPSSRTSSAHYTGGRAAGPGESPDRLDALVWALTDLDAGRRPSRDRADAVRSDRI